MAGMVEMLNGALLSFLNARGLNATEVTGFEEDTEYDGYCETCFYEYTVVRIQYTDSQGQHEYTYRGYFSELIRELTD